MGDSLAGSTFGMPNQLVRAGIGGGVPAGNPVLQATTGSAHPTAVLGAPVSAASLVPHPSQTVNGSSGSRGGSNVTADPNAISPGEDANTSCDITEGIDTDGEGRDKRRRTLTGVGSPAATVTPHADEDIGSGRREGSHIEGSLSPGPSTFSVQSPERREEFEDGGDGGGRSTDVEVDTAGGGEGSSSYRGGSLPIHADLVIGADGRQSKRAGEVWRVTPCREMGCTKRPSFGLPVDAKASYCGAHKVCGVCSYSGVTCINHRFPCALTPTIALRVPSPRFFSSAERYGACEPSAAVFDGRVY